MWRAYAGSTRTTGWPRSICPAPRSPRVTTPRPAGPRAPTPGAPRRGGADDISGDPAPAPAHHPRRPTAGVGSDLDQVYAVSFNRHQHPHLQHPHQQGPPCQPGRTPPPASRCGSATAPTSKNASKKQTRCRARPPPSGKPQLNTVWMQAALLAMNISVLLQALTGHRRPGSSPRGSRLRRELINIPARRIPPRQNPDLAPATRSRPAPPQVPHRIRELPAPHLSHNPQPLPTPTQGPRTRPPERTSGTPARPTPLKQLAQQSNSGQPIRHHYSRIRSDHHLGPLHRQRPPREILRLVPQESRPAKN